MATVQVTNVRRNTYSCVIHFKHGSITYKVDYDLTTIVNIGDYVTFPMESLYGDLDYDRLALRILTLHAGIADPGEALVHEVGDALAEAFPSQLEWRLA